MKRSNAPFCGRIYRSLGNCVSARNAAGSTYSVNNLSDNRTIKNFRSFIREKLDAFILSGENELKLDPMSSEERRITHIIARKLDLRSVSQGKEPERYMTIKLTRLRNGMYSCMSLNDTQSLTLHPDQKQKIHNFIAEFPVEPQHIEEHFALPNFKKQNRRSGQSSTVRSQKLVPIMSNMSPDIEQFRISLPTYLLRKNILREIETHKVTLITGGTGCGKTTQIPQFILEEAYSLNKPVRILCTQPRRLPAIAVSKRVAVERGERLGSTVGYHIRLEQKLSAETVLTYCTSGVLLRMLTVDELASDMTHIILDEIHEREQNTDYLLIALKQALRKRNDLKIILMSATMEGNLNTFMNYFDSTVVGYIDIPSRLYNVDKFDLADILALTGYMPSSIFGGLFNANAGFMQQDYTQYYDTFPQVGEFRSDDKISDSLMYYLNNSDSEKNHSQFHNLSQQDFLSTELHSVQTEPSLLNIYSDSASSAYPIQQHQSSGFINNSYYGGNQTFAEQNQSKTSDVYSNNSKSFGNFGFSSHQPLEMNESVHYLDRVLPNRPAHFDHKIITRLRKAELNKRALISTYLNSGGQQWADGVDVDLTVDLIRYLMNSQVDGSILVFLPGYDDIVQVRNQITSVLVESLVKPMVFTLHSQINTQEQQKVFEKVPYGCRKVILSTNIAEASLTINDVVFVIDCGKVKEKTFDHTTRITQLKVTWIAKSNAEQRAGRAGRCRNGYCFRLYSKRDFDNMLETQIPEMKKAAIHDVCLHAKMFAPENMSVKKFLEMALEPPPPLAVEHSMEFLEQLGALYSDREKHSHDNYYGNNFNYTQPSSAAAFFGGASCGFRSSTRGVPKEPELTELGRVLAHLPLEPQCARLLLFGLALKCFNPVVTLVASLSHRDPFVLPMGDDRAAALSVRDEFGKRDFSDHLMLIRAFYAFSANSNRQYQFCRANFLSPQAMKMIHGIRRQLILELKRLHFLPPNVNNHDDPEVNVYSNCWPMIQGAIVAGCYPGIGFVKAGSKLRKIRTSSDMNASLHPSSVIKRQILNNSKRSDFNNKYGAESLDPVIEYLAYQELSKIDEGLTLRMVTVIPPLSVLLFAGPIRMSKEIVENFEIAEEDIPPEELKKSTHKKRAKEAKTVGQQIIEDNGTTTCSFDSAQNLKQQSKWDSELLLNENKQSELTDLTDLNGSNKNNNNVKAEKKGNAVESSPAILSFEETLTSLPTSSELESFFFPPTNDIETVCNDKKLSDEDASTSTSIICENVGDLAIISSVPTFGSNRSLSTTIAEPLPLTTSSFPFKNFATCNSLMDSIERNDLLMPVTSSSMNIAQRLFGLLPMTSNSLPVDNTINNKNHNNNVIKINDSDCNENLGLNCTQEYNDTPVDADSKGKRSYTDASIEFFKEETDVKLKEPKSVQYDEVGIGCNYQTINDFDLMPEPSTKNSIDCDVEVIDEEDEEESAVEGEEFALEYILELESWLAFKGTFDTMQSLARLRFKFMSYFLNVLKNPARETTREDLQLLECLSTVLSVDHKRNSFCTCDDLPKPRQIAQKFCTDDNSNEDNCCAGVSNDHPSSNEGTTVLPAVDGAYQNNQRSYPSQNWRAKNFADDHECFNYDSSFLKNGTPGGHYISSQQNQNYQHQQRNTGGHNDRQKLNRHDRRGGDDFFFRQRSFYGNYNGGKESGSSSYNKGYFNNNNGSGSFRQNNYRNFQQQHRNYSGQQQKQSGGVDNEMNCEVPILALTQQPSYNSQRLNWQQRQQDVGVSFNDRPPRYKNNCGGNYFFNRHGSGGSSGSGNFGNSANGGSSSSGGGYNGHLQ